MLAIKNNIMAANAARHLGKAYDSLATSVERLASGLRINSARDDAAGLAVRELMRADIAVLQQGSRNASDGISMLQTMEGAMAVMDENLIRMKELAEQAATGSYSTAQRTIMNAEFSEMADEIDRIAGATAFNGIRMLTKEDSSDAVEIHVGTTETISVARQDMRISSGGLNIEVGTGGYEAVSDSLLGVADIGAANDSTDSFLELIEDNTGAAVLTLSIEFDGEEAIEVVITGTQNGTQYFSLTEIVETINTVSLNQAVDGDGTINAYAMASIVHDNDSGDNFLKLSSRTSEAASATITAATSAGLAVTLGFTVAKGAGSDNLLTDDMDGAEGSGINIVTTDAAIDALDRITTAINIKDTARAAFGYKMNRLESTISILDIQSENLMAAESRISDVDVATEMATLTRTQVLSQAGISMLAQANQMPQMALSLLR